MIWEEGKFLYVWDRTAFVKVAQQRVEEALLQIVRQDHPYVLAVGSPTKQQQQEVHW